MNTIYYIKFVANIEEDERKFTQYLIPLVKVNFSGVRGNSNLLLPLGPVSLRVPTAAPEVQLKSPHAISEGR